MELKTRAVLLGHSRTRCAAAIASRLIVTSTSSPTDERFVRLRALEKRCLDDREREQDLDDHADVGRSTTSVIDVPFVTGR
jgi:hypothetical protein